MKTVDTTFHESDERLELYALRRLSDSDVVTIEEHLLFCDSCRDRLDDAAGYAIAMRGAARETRFQADTVRSGWFAWLRPQFALAGALAVALLAVVLVWNGNGRPASVASLQLNAMRGNDAASVRSARELDLTLTDAVAGPGTPLVEVVVDAKNGPLVWSGVPEMSGGGARAKVAKVLPAGDYWVRFYDSPGRLRHEYRLRVTGR
jgi:hypothetical protein